MDTITAWLSELGLSQYADAFQRNNIGPDLLASLTDQDLRDLGVQSLGHRKQLFKAIAESREPKAGAPASATSSHLPSPVSIAQLSGAGERRQLTVMFCDMVGFTELANRVDPEVLQGIIRSYEDACAVCITRYEGYVFQRLGDGIVAFFGYPLAHEGEAERAIHAALEIVDTLSKLDVPGAGHLAVRIGIATGLVVVSSAERGAVGETMNLASRLQAIAQPGSIVVSERVHRLAGGSFDYQDLGEQTLKGFIRPTRAYCVLGVSEAASRFEAATQEGLTPLVGREQEIGLLLERWSLARDGEGQVVLISGEAGIGKSRILSALRERLEGHGAQTLRFQCSPYYVNSAFWPSIDNFERALKFARDEQPESKLEKLEALVVAHYGRPLRDVLFIASMLSIPTEARYGTISMTPQKHKDETLRALVDLTESVAHKQPSVVMYEDVHWADPTSLEVLDLLIERVRTFPLLIVLTHRPEFQSRWSEQGHVSALNLAKLTRAQSISLVFKVTGGTPLPADLLERILVKTDGVPLFVEELTKSILESVEIKEVGDRYEYVDSSQSIAIPATLRDSLMARLDRFIPAKEIAQIGAAIGREFSYDLIVAVAPMGQAQLDEALARLSDAGLAFRRGTPPDAVYTFKHALVQDAAYDSLLKTRRAQLHAQIAQTLEKDFSDRVADEPEVLAHHFTQAGQYQRAVHYWVLAGQRALARVALAEAVAHLAQALHVIEQLPISMERDRTELDARLLLGTAYLGFLGWPAIQVNQTLEPARDIAIRLGEETKLVLVLYYIWFHHAMRCEYPQSLDAIDQIDALARSSGDSSVYVTARNLDANTRHWMGDFTRARRATDLLLQAYDFEKHGHLVYTNNHDPKCGTLSFAGHCLWALGYPDRARQAAMEQLELSRRLGHPFNLCWALTGGALGLLMRGESGLVRQWVSEAHIVAREHALTYVADVMVPWVDGIALIIQGDYADGYRKLAGAIGVWRSAGGRHEVPFVNIYLSKALIALKRFDEARSLLNEAADLIKQNGNRKDEAEVYRVLGELQWQQPTPDLPGAETSFFKALEVARSQETKGFELIAATSLSRLWQSQGKRNEANELLAPVYDWFTEGFDTKDLKEAKALLEELGR